MVGAACRRIEAGDADLGLICCEPHNLPFYAKTSGWSAVPEATVVADGTPTSQTILMRFLTPHAHRHQEEFRRSPIHFEDEL